MTRTFYGKTKTTDADDIINIRQKSEIRNRCVFSSETANIHSEDCTGNGSEMSDPQRRHVHISKQKQRNCNQ